MDNVASAIVGPVASVLTGHITQKLRNLTSYADRVKEMKDKMKVLDSQRVDNDKHLRRNRENNKEIPARLPGWLEEVENIKKEVENIPSNHIGCFNVKKKYRAGKDALMHIKDIDRLIDEKIIWTDTNIPLGRVDSKRPPSASTSGGNTQIVFKSRDKIFDDALKFLQQDDDKTRVIALCGMGGVGKTTLMKQLKEAAEDNKMFKWIVVVVVGKSSNLLKIQEVIAAHTGESLTETDETLRATLLSKRFQAFSEHKEKSLVILDDVWETIKLEDIGLASPLPNGVKLLLTSRDVQVCRQIADDPALEEVKVDVLRENEANDFFCQEAEISAEHDRDLYEIGCEIVKKCGCLPLAIKIIAATLKRKKNRSVWECRLDRLKRNDLHKNVQEIIEISYNNLKQEDDKAIFLLCGLFPEDSNIPIEDLTRFAWGLNLLNEVSTMEKARNITITSVSNLKYAYLLMNGDSDDYECVKMHDLVLAFVVNTVSKGGKDGCCIIHHEDDFSNWSKANSMGQSCKQISLACKGMSEFPIDFKFPNLTVLKLMQGDESLRFPQDFYLGMEKLQVIAFEKLKYPVVPTSFQCSANLRTLCLHECSLMFDLACIGNLSNLEVLSFANSGVTILPSTFRNLKKLRLLDVTGCYNLVIDDAVLGSLVKLEELYMRSFDERAVCFTDNNCSELAERSKKLCALEFEFIGNNDHMKNMSYVKLKRFKLSVGCYFTEGRWLHTSQGETHSYQNSLKLVTNREEILKSKINELFKNTHALYLEVNDMNTLEDVDVEFPRPPHPSRNCSFYKLRILVVSECAELKYLFTLSVATSLSKLEYLEISGCLKMEAIIHTENYVDVFSNLKYLRLAKLPELLHFCNKVDVIELPCLMELQLEGLPKIKSIYWSSDISRMQSLFNKEDATPKVEKLVLVDMENLKEIWPPQFSISNLCQLRELTVEGCGCIDILFNMDFGETEQPTSSLLSIEVKSCDSLVELLSCNPFPFFNNLQELKVERCVSVEVIFNIDMGCVGEMDKVSSSRLRSIRLDQLRKLREVWRIKDAGNNLIHGFEAVESINIRDCERFENLITPATTNFDMRALKEVQIRRCGKESESNQEQEIHAMSVLREDSDDVVSKIAFPSSLLPTFHKLQKLTLEDYKPVEVVFEITTPSSKESPHNTQQPPILPYLEKLELEDMGKMSHVWKCNWNEFLILQKPHSRSSFHDLTTIVMYKCNNIKYLFSPLMAKLLSNLKKVDIWKCDGIEEVVSNRDQSTDSLKNTSLFPHLDILDLSSLEKLKCIGGSANGISTDIHDQLIYLLGHSVECGLNFRVTTTSHQARLPSYESTSSYGPTTMERLPWSYHNLIEVDRVYNPRGRRTLFSSDKLLQLQKLETVRFGVYGDTEQIFDSQIVAEIPNLRQVDLDGLSRLEYIWKSKRGTVLKFPNLTRLSVYMCSRLEYVFTCPMVGSLLQLQELHIICCNSMKVIVKGEEEECDARMLLWCSLV